MSEPRDSDAERRALLAAALARAAKDAGIATKGSAGNAANEKEPTSSNSNSDRARSERFVIFGVMSSLLVGLSLYKQTTAPHQAAVMLGLAFVSFFIAACYTERAYATIQRLVRRMRSRGKP